MDVLAQSTALLVQQRIPLIRGHALHTAGNLDEDRDQLWLLFSILSNESSMSDGKEQSVPNVSSAIQLHRAALTFRSPAPSRDAP
jgi:hypothetical protein